MALLALSGAVIPVVHLYGNRSKPGALWLLALCVVLALYPLDVLFLSGEVGVRHRFSTIALVAPLYLLAMVSYLRMKPSHWVAISRLLYGYMLLAFAAPWLPGTWYLSFPAEQPYASFHHYLYALEPGAWGMKVASYLCILIAACMVLQRLSASRYSRSYLLALALAPLCAGLADLISALTHFSPYHGITALQIVVTFGLYVLSYALLRRQMLVRVPVSRNLLMSHLREGICVISSSGEIIDCNEALGAIVGIAPTRLLGRISNHVLPEPLLEQLDVQRLEGSVVDAEAYLENTRRSVSVSVKPLVEGEAGASLLLCVTDVTDRTNELASVTAVADELQEANEQLIELSNTDSLTGLGNRRLLHETLANRLLEEDSSSGLVMVDIDHFKTINDTHGHAAGDAVLIRLAQTMRDTCRDKDLIVRWGGEEFVVLLHDADAQRVQLAAERLRLHIRRLVIELDNGVALQVTASIGAALVRPGQSAESALRLVDRLLYEAKQEGRDRVKASRPT